MKLKIENNNKELICNSFEEFNKKIKPINELTIIHLNIRSIDANFNQLEATINAMDTKPNVIVCTETWNVTSINLYKMQDYDIYYNNSRTNIADGVIVYIKNNLQ